MMMTRFVTFTLLFTAATASATTWPSVSTDLPLVGGGERDAAVIIGVSNYTAIPAIPGATDNAVDWFRYLAKVRGVPGENVRIIKDNEAVKENIEEAAQQVAQNVGEGGTIWFIFIGHGAPNEAHDDGLLVGWDTQETEKSLVARGVPQKSILATIEADTKHANAVIVWDACFSGSTGDGKTPLVRGSQATVPVKRVAAAAGGRAVIFAASDQVAGPLPGHDRPAFTYLLLGALRGWADKAPLDGTITTSEAFNYTRDTLRTMVQGRTQVPSLVASAQPFALATRANERGPDLIDIRSLAAPAAELFKGSALTVPVIDTRSLGGFALGELNINAERAFENAQDAQESTTASAEAKRELWCALAGISDNNPYLEVSQKACTQWSSYITAEKEMTANMATDFGVLLGYVDLRRKTPEQKLAAVDSFLSVYGKYAGHQEVLAAKVGRENLAAGRPIGIARDGDRWIIDGPEQRAAELLEQRRREAAAAAEERDARVAVWQAETGTRGVVRTIGAGVAVVGGVSVIGAAALAFVAADQNRRVSEGGFETAAGISGADSTGVYANIGSVALAIVGLAGAGAGAGVFLLFQSDPPPPDLSDVGGAQ